MIEKVHIDTDFDTLSLDLINKDNISMAFWQPQDELTYHSQTGIGLRNGSKIEESAREFINNYYEFDLILTPEYSFPWQVLDEILEKHLVAENRLQCLCMQSIPKDIFFEWYDNRKKTSEYMLYPAREHIFANNKKYVNLLIYVFRYKDKIALIIQSKIKPYKTGENEDMSEGDRLYVFGKSSSRQFFSLICADTLIENNEDINDLCFSQNTILFHPQLNAEGKDIDYRSKEYSLLRSDTNLYISLNWALYTNIEDDRHGGCSSLRYCSREPKDITDLHSAINENHCKGLFFSYERSAKQIEWFLYQDEQVLSLSYDYKKRLPYNVESKIYGSDKGKLCRICLNFLTGIDDIFQAEERCLKNDLCDSGHSNVLVFDNFFNKCCFLEKLSKTRQLEHSNFDFYRVAYLYNEGGVGGTIRQTYIDSLFNKVKTNDFSETYKHIDKKFSLECADEFCNAMFDDEEGRISITVNTSEKELRGYYKQLYDGKLEKRNIILLYFSNKGVREFNEFYTGKDITYMEYIKNPKIFM